MATSEGCREVARRLREARGGWSSGECYSTIIHALGLPDTSREDGGHALYAALADLIEPGPGRTCRVVSQRPEGDSLLVTELSCGHVVEGYRTPRYCEDCGAEVMDE